MRRVVVSFACLLAGSVALADVLPPPRPVEPPAVPEDPSGCGCQAGTAGQASMLLLPILCLAFAAAARTEEPAS